MSARPDAPPAPIRIGSRGSALALVQANLVRDRLVGHGVPAEIVVIRTAGDERAPDTAWGEGAFVGAIEAALLDGRVDAAVHSAKDVPTDEDPRLVIAAWTAREDPRDALVCRVRGTTLATLRAGARVGTDSPRRTAFLRSLRPDLAFHALSGNVDTRLAKLDARQSDALVLAVAGLTRLGRTDRIDDVLPLDIAVPAPGQGALALQARADDTRTRDALAVLDDPASRVAVETERAFLTATGGGCRSPIGALGTVERDTLTLRVAAERAFPLPGGATVRGGVVRLVATAPSGEGLQLATKLAADVVRLRSHGRVLVTRPCDGAASTVDALRAAGLDPVAVPTIETRDEPGTPELVAVVSSGVAPDAWLVATSPNGVRAALALLDAAGIEASAARWAVVGRGSAELLAPRGITPFVPERPTGAALADGIPVAAGDRAVLVRGDLADRGLVAALAARGAAVTEVIAYRTIEGPEASRSPLAEALDRPLDALAFASGSAVRGLFALAPPDSHPRLRATPAVCIGPTTAAVARGEGFARVVEAADTSPSALAAAVASALAASLPPADLPEDPGPDPSRAAPPPPASPGVRA